MNHKLKYIPLLFVVIFAASCSHVKYIPVETFKEIHVHDTTYIKADTVKIPVPFESVREVVPDMDTLKMSTSVAEAEAWVDKDTKTLKGMMRNRKAELEKEAQYKERVVYRDSVAVKEVPVPVEVVKRVVPRFYRWILRINILGVIIAAAWGYLKFFKGGLMKSR